LIAHNILIRPPQSHLKTSNPKTLFINSAQLLFLERICLGILEFSCCFPAPPFFPSFSAQSGQFSESLSSDNPTGAICSKQSKTQLIEFGRFAEMNAARKGGKPATFDFLRFTYYCGQTKNGAFKVKRMTSKKKYRVKLQAVKAWLRTERNREKTGLLLGHGKRLLEGHLEYYAITDNGIMCNLFRYQVAQLLFKWLNRRSQRRSYMWERFNDALAWIGWSSVRIKHPLGEVEPE
jgi:RNA-directed DNA polymerase